MAGNVVQDLGWDRLALAGGAPVVQRWRGWPFVPFATALILHLLLVSVLVTHASSTAGIDKADPERLIVQVLDASAFTEQFPSTIMRKSVTEAAPPPAPTAPPAPKPQPVAPATKKPPAPPAPAPSVDDGAILLNAPLPVPKPELDLSVPKSDLSLPAKKQAMSAAEFVARQLGGSAKQRAGEIDAFTRAVDYELERAKPVSNGIIGEVVVSFVVSPQGQVEDLQIVRSSGDSRLDRLVLSSVHGLHVRVPPAYADTRDRTFEITYDYKN